MRWFCMEVRTIICFFQAQHLYTYSCRLCFCLTLLYSGGAGYFKTLIYYLQACFSMRGENRSMFS